MGRGRLGAVVVAGLVLLTACGDASPTARPDEVQSFPRPMLGDEDGDGIPDGEEIDDVVGGEADGEGSAEDGTDPADATAEGTDPDAGATDARTEDGRPATWHAVLRDGRVVTVSTASGEVLRTVHTYDVGQAQDEFDDVGSFTGPDTLTRGPDRTLLVGLCCEPAVGAVDVLPIDGSAEPEFGGYGYDPDLPDRGRRVAVVTMGYVSFVRPDLRHLETTTQSIQWERETATPTLSRIAWDAAGDRMAMAYWDHETDQRGILVLDADAARMEDGRLLPAPAGREWTTPEWRQDGRLLVAEVSVDEDDPTARVLLVDPATGDVEGDFPLAHRPWTMGYDTSRTWLLVTYDDGRGVEWFGRGRRGRLATENAVLDATW